MHDSKTHPEPHTQKLIFETLVCVVLVLVGVPFAWWTMMAELCYSVDDFVLDFFSNTAADTASERDGYGHRRCCPAATVPVAVVFACGACCCIDEEIQNKIIDRKTELRHHRPPSKATSTRTTHTRVSKMGFWVCGSGCVFESCTFYLHDGRANRGCQSPT